MFTLFGYELGGLNGAAIALSFNYILGIVFTLIFLAPVLKIRMKFTRIIHGLCIFFLFLLAAFLLTGFTELDGNIVGAFIIPLFLLSPYLTKVLSGNLIGMALQMLRKDKNAS